MVLWLFVYTYQFETLLLIFLDIYVRMKWLSHMVILFNALRNSQTVFHSSCTIWLSYQGYTRVPIFPHHHQHLLFYFCVYVISTLWEWSESHCGFDSWFPHGRCCWASSIGLLVIFIFFLNKCHFGSLSIL